MSSVYSATKQFSLLPPELSDVVYNSSFESVHEILHYSPQDLEKRLKISKRQSEYLLRIISEFYFPLSEKHRTALDLRSSQQRLSSGCAHLDSFLRGGIIVGDGLTELAGESGSGKTQLCLQLALMAQVSVANNGLGGKALYIACDSPFPFQRYQELYKHFSERFPVSGSESTSLSHDNLFIAHFLDLETLHHILRYHLEVNLARDPSLKLVIIDSIASNFRTEVAEIGTSAKALAENGLLSIPARSRLLYEISSTLKRLASTFGICIVVVNQVSDRISSDGIVADNCKSASESLSQMPTLGLSWSNMVNTRLQMVRTRRPWHLSSNSTSASTYTIDNIQIHGSLHVAFSCDIPSQETCQYEIRGDGVRGLDSCAKLIG